MSEISEGHNLEDLLALLGPLGSHINFEDSEYLNF